MLGRSGQFNRWSGLIADGAPEVVLRPHSAGALQDWATCPYRYFLGRVLRIEERDELRDDLQITALDKGSLIHGILDQFFKQGSAQPAPGGRWSTGEHERLAALANEHLDEAERQGLTGRDLLWRRERRLILNDLQTLLDRDDEQRAELRAQQVASELAFGELPESEAEVSLALTDGNLLSLRGVIDRIDRSADGERLIVIDYKTGRERPGQTELLLDPVVGGRFLQLPIYAHAARQIYGLDGQSVTSAYWFITERGNFTLNAVEWNAENTERFEWAINLIIDQVRAGRFPANPGGEQHRARGEHCAYCSFDAICPADRRSRWERIKGDPQLAEYIALSADLDEEADDV